MSVKRRQNWVSQQRVDVPHIKSIESAVSNDFDELLTALVTGETESYVIRGFNLSMTGAIGASAAGLQMLVSDSAILHNASNESGTFYVVPDGTAPEVLNAVTNTRVDGSFTPGAVNYVGIEFVREVDDTTTGQIYLWSPSNSNETTKSVPLAITLDYKIVITTSTFASNVLPIALVTTDLSNNVSEVTNQKPQLFSLQKGGAGTPDPSYEYPYNEGREPNAVTSNNSAISPFEGGDLQFQHQKDWMDAVMSRFKDILGTPFWTSLNTSGSLASMRADLGNTIFTGRGTVTHDAVTAGQMNWSHDLSAVVVGSELKYVITANPATTDIILADDEVAYISLVRNVDIIPNLIFTNASAVVTSVGAVTWTSGLQAGDYVKTAIAGIELYYEILTVDSPTQVTLTSTYAEGDTGAIGTQSQYAYGTYETNAAPSTDRHIKTALRDQVPTNESTYWIMIRQDNSGSVPRVYARFLGKEIEQGESQDVNDGTPQAVLDYMGSMGEADDTPDYGQAYTALLAEVSTITAVAASDITDGQYFTINSANDVNQYYVWFNKDAGGADPTPAGLTAIEVAVSTGNNQLVVATAIHAAIDALGDFNSVDNANGTLTVTNNDLGATTDAANVDVGGAFSINIDVDGTGDLNRYVVDDDNLTKGVKTLDKNLGIVADSLAAASAIVNQDRNSHLIEGGTWSNASIPVQTSVLETQTFETFDVGSIVTNVAGLPSNTSAIAQKFQATSANDITKVRVSMRRIDGTSTVDMQMTIRDDAGPANVLGNVVATATATINSSTLTAVTGDTIDFTFPASTNLVVGNDYYIVVTAISGDINTDSILVGVSGTGDPYAGYSMWESPNDGVTSFNSYVTTRDWYTQVYTNEPQFTNQESLTWSADAYVQIPGRPNARNTLLAQSINMPNAGEVAYVDLNRDSGPTDNLTVTVADADTLVLNDDRKIIARKVTDGILVGESFLLKDGEYLELDGALAEINRLLGQLKIEAHESDVDKARISTSEIVQLDGTTLNQVIGNFMLRFDGAVIDFTTGEVFESDGSTPLGNDFTPPTIPASEYHWFGISLLPGTLNGINEQLATVQIDIAESSNASAAAAPIPVISGLIKRGWIQVQNDGGQITLNDVRRLGPGSGSGGGAGGSAKDVYEDRLSFSTFNMVSAIAFNEDQDDYIDPSSTGSNSPADDYAFKFGAVSQTMIDLNNATDVDFLDSELDINEAELYLHWKEGFVDTAATYEFSRDGGNEYQVITMQRVGTTNAYRGYHIFDDEAANQNLDAQATPDATRDLTDTGADVALAAQFTPSTVRVLKEIDIELNKLGAPTGTYKVKIVRDDTGAPSTSPADIISESAQLDVADVATGNDTVTVAMPKAVLKAGEVYWMVIETDADYKASYSAASIELSIRVDATSPTADGASFNGTAWSTTAGESWAFQTKGRELDLRVRVTAGTIDTLIEGYGVYYEQSPGIAVADGKLEIDEFVFEGSENRTAFTLINISNPHPDLLEIKDVFRGQEYIAREGVCRIDGQTITFDPDFFDDAGETIHLVFKQLKAGVIDNSDANANKIATIESALVDIGDQLESVSDSMVLPKIAVPNTTIVNRSEMPDLSMDLKPRFGVDRIAIKESFEIQDEQGPNGEPVLGFVNDKFNQVRFVGENWENLNNATGQTVRTDTSGEYIEVVFYGTGLNLLATGYADLTDVRVSVDGGAESGNLIAATPSSILIGRNYTLNSVVPLVSGETLGLHTVRIINGPTASSQIQCSGVEILNENASGNIITNPGAQLYKGKRLVNSTQDSAAYNAGFETGTLGTRGGHVLVYQKADGTVAKAVTPTDAAQADLGAANHANEEVIRKIHWREFGAGRSDDFSTLATVTSDRAFTLDDGTTTLVGNDVASQSNAIRISGVSGFVTITFVGTGLDFIDRFSAANTETLEVFVDGSSIGTFTNGGLVTPLKQRKIVSGLPYGTHTVGVDLNSGGVNGDYDITDFIIYGPKTPALPANSKAISDYFIMAGFVANTTVGNTYIATGVLRKSPHREFIYEGTWSQYGVSAPLANGQNLAGNNVDMAHSYTFYGTGFDWRMQGGGGTSTDVKVYIDGLLFNTTNYPTEAAAANAYGVSFNSGTGSLNLTGGANSSGFTVSGLSLDTHTVRFENDNANFVTNEALDIITPIHSPKQVGAYVVQNALEVGSQGIRDLRKFSKKDVREELAIANAVAITNSPTTTSIAHVPLEDLITTIKTNKGFIEVSAHLVGFNSSSGNGNGYIVYIDGKLAQTMPSTYSAVAAGTMSSHLTKTFPVSAGYHTIQIFWNVTGTTGTTYSTRSLSIREVK